MTPAFAVWLTGIPASGKSSIAVELARLLAEEGVQVELLESDALREVITPEPTWAPGERAAFYRAMAFYGSRLAARGTPVVFDATANRRAFRALARALVPRFLEVAVECPLEVARARDRKGTYLRGEAGLTATVPGLQEPYEPPESPELTIDTTRTGPGQAARIILDALHARGWLGPSAEEP